MALKIEKLKAPLFGGPKGAGATNDWCIMIAYFIMFLKPVRVLIIFSIFLCMF